MRGDMEISDPDAPSMDRISFRSLGLYVIFEEICEPRSTLKFVSDDILLKVYTAGQILLIKRHLNSVQEAYCSRRCQYGHGICEVNRPASAREFVSPLTFNRTIHRHRRACAVQQAV